MTQNDWQPHTYLCTLTMEEMPAVPQGKIRATTATLLLLALSGSLLLRASYAHKWSSSDESSIRHLSEALPTEEGELKPLLPLEVGDYFGFIAAVVALLIAAGGGIGGGGLLVPIFLLVMDFPVKHAVSLSNVTVFGGAVANALLNAQKTHPLANRPLIDWNLLAMMEPLTMVGALIGADLNEILPDVVVVVLLVLLLGYTGIKTLEKVRIDSGNIAVLGHMVPFLTHFRKILHD
jgi:Sulfite exporter TauE/SafE